MSVLVHRYDASCFIHLDEHETFTQSALEQIPFPMDGTKLESSAVAEHFYRGAERPVFKLTGDEQPDFVGVVAGWAESPVEP